MVVMVAEVDRGVPGADDVFPTPIGADGVRSLSPTDVAQFIRLDQCGRYLRLRRRRGGVRGPGRRDRAVAKFQPAGRRGEEVEVDPGARRAPVQEVPDPGPCEDPDGLAADAGIPGGDAAPQFDRQAGEVGAPGDAQMDAAVWRAGQGHGRACDHRSPFTVWVGTTM